MAAKKNVKDISARKNSGEKITVLTAYDVSMARVLDDCGIDILLVGDSLGMVVLGYDSTVPVTMEEMLHHCRAVSRGTKQALVVGDMPFGSYQVAPQEAIANGIRFLKEAGCDAVKVEGGEEICPTVAALVKAGIPVMGHIGLTPQTAGQLGGFKIQGRDLQRARQLLADARALTHAGAFAIVLECIPSELASLITSSITIPTIGIGAGPDCDGQVLVTNDLLGFFDKFTPSFVKKYLQLATQIKEAVELFKSEVHQGAFPAAEHSFHAHEDFRKLLDD